MTQGKNAMRVTVPLGQERSYDIVIGSGLLHDAGALLAPVLKGRGLVVVADTVTAGHFGEALGASLKGAGFDILDTVVFPPGEGSKSFAALQHLCERALGSGLNRTGCLLALGGGVVGDLAGLAAAVIMRGVDFVQVPTTLLAQVDSAVGGKTAINLPQGKNLVGAFHQPRLVLADTDTLKTLPPRELRAGYAEIVKYGLINDAAFFAWLEQQGEGEKVLALEPRALAQAVATSCKAKAAIVAQDEKEESGLRALLNLGHTFGHGLEALAGYDSGRLLHGEAVAVGMAMAFSLSAQLGFCASDDVARVHQHIEKSGLSSEIPAGVEASMLLDAMFYDKKAVDKGLRFVLARGIGKAFLSERYSREQVANMLEGLFRRRGAR